ncbi:MAG: aromatic amino acid ammonia-lyase [Acidobacteria bacterium]|nr:aromatic amino acid ammonia-lyase [Acidobacteriota bacterium]
MNINGENLSAFDVYRVAVQGEKVSLDQNGLERVKASFDRVQKWGAAKQPVYGVNTGFGELANVIIPPQYKSELQKNLLRSHAAGSGQPFPDEIVRAIMVSRLNCLMKGYSGVSLQALEMMRHFLNRGIHPVVPQQGSLGASGDLAPLSHLALPLIGLGRLRVRGGEARPASEVLEEENLKPLEPGFKEALALVNGTSAMTGVACSALIRAHKLLQLAVFASADLLQCLGASTRAFDHRGHALKNHAGQVLIAQALRRLLDGSTLTPDHRELMKSISEQAERHNGVAETTILLQPAYTLRCIPQILGPVADTLNFCRRIFEEELNSCNDNPLIFETAEDAFHGGNFHGQYVAMGCDYLNIALTEIGALAERQLNRLLDPHINGKLPPFLASGDSGLFCGFEGAQYLATSIASENLGLAVPASVKSIPSNGQNQDIVSMGLISGRKSLQLCDNVLTILSVLIAACYQASHFIGPEKFNSPISELHLELSSLFGLYKDDFPISELITETRDHLMSERRFSALDALVDLGFSRLEGR